MLQFIPNHNKTKKKMYKKAADYYPILEYNLDCYVTQEMCTKAVNIYPSALMHVSNCY